MRVRAAICLPRAAGAPAAPSLPSCYRLLCFLLPTYLRLPQFVEEGGGGVPQPLSVHACLAWLCLMEAEEGRRVEGMQYICLISL